MHVSCMHLPPRRGLEPQSGRRDSNPGPLVPQTSALTKLRHAPRRGNRSSVSNEAVTEGWEEQDGALVRTFELGSFAEAIAFVGRIAEAAEAANHHPDIDIRYRRVTVRWMTHSDGGITDKDRELAGATSTFVHLDGND